jgi:hypothetical protein
MRWVGAAAGAPAGAAGGSLCLPARPPARRLAGLLHTPPATRRLAPAAAPLPPSPPVALAAQVPLCKVNLQGLEALLQQYKGRYSTVVGFQPTGWTHAKESASAKCGRRMQRGTVILHQVRRGRSGAAGCPALPAAECWQSWARRCAALHRAAAPRPQHPPARRCPTRSTPASQSCRSLCTGSGRWRSSPASATTAAPSWSACSPRCAARRSSA